MVDTYGSEPYAERFEGSSPSLPTLHNISINLTLQFIAYTFFVMRE